MSKDFPLIPIPPNIQVRPDMDMNDAVDSLAFALHAELFLIEKVKFKITEMDTKSFTIERNEKEVKGKVVEETKYLPNPTPPPELVHKSFESGI